MTSENERLVLFSDAVIAITITLMVLEIRLPEGVAGMTDAEIWAALVALTPRYLSYILSFLVIGVFWNGHRQKFETIVRSSGRLVWLNLLFLLAIGFMPFVTDMLAESGGTLATVIYAGLVLVISMISAAISLHAFAAKLTDGEKSRRELVTPPLATALVFGLSIPVALWDADFGKYFWILLAPLSFVLARVGQRR